MGKAVNDRKSQIEYVKNRINLLKNVVDTMDAEHADVEDMDRLLKMMNDLQIKLNRFRKDWANEE
ncbi:SE1561 family protein [Bacillus tianshenii]|nr:SE1561 family protein [Bacillus tianshenii]